MSNTSSSVGGRSIAMCARRDSHPLVNLCTAFLNRMKIPSFGDAVLDSGGSDVILDFYRCVVNRVMATNLYGNFVKEKKKINKEFRANITPGNHRQVGGRCNTGHRRSSSTIVLPQLTLATWGADAAKLLRRLLEIVPPMIAPQLRQFHA